MVTGGFGLGRLPDGLVALVPLVLPGEQVRIRPRRRRKNHLEADLVEVLQPAPERVEPPCPFFGRCGGCDLQHAAYEAQVRYKEALLYEHLERSGLSVPENCREEPLAASKSLAYRQRIRLQVDQAGRVGFFRLRSHQVEPVSRCLLARPELNRVWAELERQAACTRLLAASRSLELLVSLQDRQVILLLGYRRRPRPQEIRLAKELVAATAGVKGLLFTGPDFEPIDPLAVRTGTASLLSSFLLSEQVTGSRPLSLTVEPGGFCQVNPEQNERLIRLLLEWVAIQPEERVLDLFCGMGNFSLPLALRAGEVVGCDLQRAAIRSARRNAELAGLSNCRFFQQSAAEGAQELLTQEERFDCILLDPPRQGCAAVIPLLHRLGARRLAYISCDPATLARDLGSLARTGYRLRRLCLVDMFPQTHHLETLTLLERDGS